MSMSCYDWYEKIYIQKIVFEICSVTFYLICKYNMKTHIVCNNDILSPHNLNNDDIFIITQFFIHADETRYNEIKTCLKKNIELRYFKKIILLNERIYSLEELGITKEQSNYILQVNIDKRLTYADCLTYLKTNNLNGYIVISNSDIFFDNTIINIRKSCLSISKSIYTLIRYEYTDENLDKCKLYTISNNVRRDSQDTWIIHTQSLDLSDSFIKLIDFYLGVPGCDNKIAYIFNQHGYRCFNVPSNVKTYHNHVSNIRNYTNIDRLSNPYLFVRPVIYSNYFVKTSSYHLHT